MWDTIIPAAATAVPTVRKGRNITGIIITITPGIDSPHGNVMKILGNIIWLIFGGIMIAIEYFICSILMMLTIVGIPFGLQTLKLAALSLWPFGTQIESDGWPSGCLAGIMNVVWWFVGGFVIALTHVFWGLFFYITILGIPFGNQHFKLAYLALFPFGKTVY